MALQLFVDVSRDHKAPLSSIGAMATPPRPENMYMVFPIFVVAAPTRGIGALLVGLIDSTDAVVRFAMSILWRSLSLGSRGFNSPPKM